MNKPSRSFARPLRDLLGKVVGETFTRQGFASAELVTRWTEVVGGEIATYSEPIKIQWTPAITRSAARVADAQDRQADGTLVLRVEGPASLEIQHLAGVICERVNRFLGWRAVTRIALRQAPLRRPAQRTAATADPAAAARVAAELPEIADEALRRALGRLGAATKRRSGGGPT